MDNWTPPEGAVELKSKVQSNVPKQKSNSATPSAEDKVASDISKYTEQRKAKGLSTYYSPEAIAEKVKIEKKARTGVAVPWASVTKEEENAYKRYSSNNTLTADDVIEVKNRAAKEKTFKTVGEKRQDESLTSIGAAVENWWEGDADKAYVPFEDEKKQVLKEAKKANKKYTPEQINSLAERKYQHRQYGKLINNKAEQYLKDISGDEQDLLESKAIKVKNVEQRAFDKKSAVNKMLTNDLDGYSRAFDRQLKEIQAYGKDPKFSSQDEVNAYNDKVNNIRRIQKEVGGVHSAYTANLEEYDKSSKKLGKAEEEYDLAKRHYGTAWEFTKIVPAVENFVEGAVGFASMIGDTGVWVPQKLASLITGDEAPEFLSDRTKSILKFKREREETQSGFYARPREIENVETFFEKGWDLVATQIPNITLMALTMGAGGAEIAAAEVATEAAVAEGAVVASEVAEGAVARTVAGEAAAIAEKQAIDKAVKISGQEAIEAVSGKITNSAKWLETIKANPIGKKIIEAGTLEGIAPKVIAASSAGTKFLDLADTNDQGVTNYDPLQMVASSLLYGYAEGVGENVTMDIFKGAVRPLQALAKDEGKKAFLDTLKKDTIGAWLGKRGVDMLNENVSEQVTNLAQNAIDKFMLNKNVGLLDNTATVFKDTTLLTSLMIGVPHIGGLVIKPFIPLSDQTQMRDNSSQIAMLMHKMNTPGINEATLSAYKAKAATLTQSNSDLANKTIQRVGGMPDNTFDNILNLDKARRDIQVKAQEVLNGNGTQEQKAEALNIFEQEYNTVDNELAVIHNNIKMMDTISNDYTPEDRKDIYNLLVEHKDLSEKMKSMDPMQKQEAADKIKDINNNFIAHNIRLNVEKAINKDAANALKAKEALGLDKLEVLSFDNSDDIEDWFTINAPISKEEAADKTKADNYSEWVGEQSNKFGIFVPRKDGSTVLIINKELSAQKGVVTTGQHEFLHALIYNAVKANPELAKKMGTDLYNFLESSISKEVLEGTEFKKRHDGYKNDFIEEKKSFEEQQKAEIEEANKETNGAGMTRTAADIKAKYAAKINQAEAKYLEETLTLLSEAISEGDIKYNETFFTKLGDFIRRVLQNYGVKVSFATGQDVFNFVRDYNKSYENGKFTDAFKALAIKGEYVGPKQTSEQVADLSIKSSKSVAALKEELSNVKENEYEYGDPYEYADALTKIEGELKRAIAKEAAGDTKKPIISKEVAEENEVKDIIKNERGTLSSDKVQKIYETKGINGAQDIIDLFKPITNKIVDKRRDAPGFDRELLTDEIETGSGGILDLIRSYKVTKEVPLAAYINKQLPLRAIAASRRVLDVQFNKDASEEVGLVATETADQNMTERVAEKPKYKNALESNVFEPAVIESIKGKILSTLRLLKNRIDTQVTLNRTVTPIIAEIRDEMGKQADIDIKTAMGGKKDGQLKSFLLKNKKYILENMTTTWLMGKDGQGGMPIAIQKRINGRWTNFPDWVGQKIDRESTSTDLAGRTSGAELARRLPSVNANISNEDFLAQILGSDGNPLRGRKESLAKAMAEEISFELIAKDLADKGPLYEALEANQTRLEAKLSADLDIEFNKQVERGNIKNSENFKGRSIRLQKGLAISQRKLKAEIISAGKNTELAAKYIMRWLASDGRSIRTKSWAITGKKGEYTTNKNLLEKVLYPILKDSVSVDFMIDNEDYINLVDVITGQKIYFGDKPVELWMQTEDLKRNWEKLKGGAIEESTYAIDDLVDTVKYAKENNLTEEEFSDYIFLLSQDQRGLVRKVSSPGLGFTNLVEKDKPYVEHNPPRFNIIDDIEKLYNSKLTAKDIKEFKAKIGNHNVNLIPKALNNLLPKYEEGKNRMRDKNVLLYISNAIKNGAEITGFGAEYGSKANFDNLVAAAKEGFDTNQIANETNMLNALALYGIKSSKPIPKGISVFDFDDTSAFTSGSVLYTTPDGLKGKLNAEEFAKEGSYMLDAGAIFDFSEFSKVVDGRPGPMVEKMKKMIAKFGNENFFILTARPANAAGPIKEFLDSIGIDIPLENITGLGNSTAQAKADWMIAKAAEGYNDFYFADDAIQNVEAVKKALDIPGVDSKIQRAIIKSSLTTKVNLDWETKFGVTSADFKISEYTYNIQMATVKDYGLSEHPVYKKVFGKMADKLGLPLTYLTDNKNLLWVSFAEEDQGTSILNTGNAFEVLGIVTNGLVEYIQKNNIEGIAFDAEESSRIRLYKTLSSTIGSRLGWTYGTEEIGNDDGTIFLVNSQKNNVSQNQSKPVRDALNIVDIKSPIQQAMIKFSLTSKQDLKWNYYEDSSFADFEVKGKPYKIELADSAYIDYPELLIPTINKLIEKYNLNKDDILQERAGKTYQLIFEGYKGGTEITGTGNAAEVFGVVINGVIEYAKNKDTETFVFAAKEPSRRKLYNAMANVIANKIGWNSFYDNGVYIISKKGAIGNIETFDNQSEQVKNVLNVVDVKSPIQQARIKSSKKLSEDFNKIIEVNTGMEDFKVFSDIVAKRRGAGKGKYRFFLPPSAEDFTGLLYDFLGKGKVGEEQFAFFKKNLIDPYVAGTALIDSARQSIKRDYKTLLSAFPEVRKKLGKKIPSGDFTYDQAIRVSMWTQSGVEIPGLSQRDITKLNDLVNSDPELVSFKDNLIITGRQADGWIAPTEFWDADTIISDLHNITEKVGRKKFLAGFIENVSEIFSKENLNKIEAVYGSNFREALEDSIYRMSNGTNRPSGSNRLTNQWNNWVNNSTGAIMFFNTRSALLQVISGMNFLNWSDNNPASAALAFADQKQYWKDFVYIFNSDKMKERRSGLKEDVSAAEIANAAEGSKNKVGAVLSYLLKLGFTPTQIADSFAISAGGSTFYRNRIKTYVKQGMSEKEAEAEAWKDFSKTADENQQSSDPMLISQQQTSSIGRLILAFQNTPMQYNRLMKKAARDLINKRGNPTEHISKILYYGAVQSFIFNALQSALFAVAFSGGDDEEKEKEINKKSSDIIDGMIDGIIRGSGLGGAIVVTLKNAIQKYQEESEKGFKGDNAKVLLQLLNISPAIGSKASKIYGSMQTAIFEKEVVKEMGWSVTKDGRINISPNYEIAGSLIEGTTNIPMNRLVSKVENMSEALDSRNATWQRIASALGWKPYTIGVVNEEQDLIKAGAKVRKKAEGKDKAKLTRLENKLKELDRLSNMTTEEYDQYIRVKKLENKEKYLDRKLKKLQEEEMFGNKK